MSGTDVGYAATRLSTLDREAPLEMLQAAAMHQNQRSGVEAGAEMAWRGSDRAEAMTPAHDADAVSSLQVGDAAAGVEEASDSVENADGEKGVEAGEGNRVDGVSGEESGVSVVREEEERQEKLARADDIQAFEASVREDGDARSSVDVRDDETGASFLSSVQEDDEASGEIHSLDHDPGSDLDPGEVEGEQGRCETEQEEDDGRVGRKREEEEICEKERERDRDERMEEESGEDERAGLEQEQEETQNQNQKQEQEHNQNQKQEQEHNQNQKHEEEEQNIASGGGEGGEQGRASTADDDHLHARVSEAVSVAGAHFGGSGDAHATTPTKEKALDGYLASPPLPLVHFLPHLSRWCVLFCCAAWGAEREGVAQDAGAVQDGGERAAPRDVGHARRHGADLR
eukprot:621000-Rhodomonas_salina.3